MTGQGPRDVPLRPPLRKRLARAGALAAGLVAVWLLVSFLVAYRLTRRAHAPFPEPAPAVGWGQFRDVRLRSADGEELGAWFSPGRPDRPVVLLLHGNGGCRAHCLPRAEWLAGQGYGVFLVSLRCHGDSTGTLNDFGYSARHDVLAALGWLEADQPGRPCLVWGQSLGAAAAVFAAGEAAGRVHGYILEAPYRDVYTATRNRTELRLPPGLDRVAYAGLITVAPWVLPDPARIAPVDAIAAMPAGLPVLILAGGRDRHARPEEAAALCARIAGQARLVVVEGADHHNLWDIDPPAIRRVVRDFFEAAERGGPGP